MLDNKPFENGPDKVEVTPEVFLFRRVAPFYKTLVRSTLPFIRIDATPVADLPVTDSKFGGKPYMPHSQSVPFDQNGHVMLLLAQLNFEEIPHITGYPESGILQFFISTSDDCYGLNFDHPTHQNNFRIVFHGTVDPKSANLNVIYRTLESKDSDDYPPISAEHKLTFHRSEERIGPKDSRFKQFFGKDFYALSQDVDDEDNNFWGEFHVTCNNTV